MLPAVLFLCAILFNATPWSSPPLGLLLGLACGVLNLNRWSQLTVRASREMLKLSVVGLGFGMDLHAILRTGQVSFFYTGAGIALGLLLGLALGRMFRVSSSAAFLIAVGTSVCGGSAIAAVAPLIGAEENETALSLSTIFILNSVGLLLFPAIGMALGLTPTQFGLWAGVAIHDTSSVVGAGLRYGPLALSVATTVKLVRALWILPLTALTALVLKARRAVAVPWFIALFLCAAWLRSTWPSGVHFFDWCVWVARTGLTMTLFLIGSSLSFAAIKQVGWRLLAQGSLLWLLGSIISLVLIQKGWIGL